MANSFHVHLAGCAGSGREESWCESLFPAYAITVASALRCPVCVTQDAARLVTVGGRR